MTAMTWTPEGRRKVGRPKTTWRRTVKSERQKLGWRTWNAVKPVAEDRVRWRGSIAAVWSTWTEEDRRRSVRTHFVVGPLVRQNWRGFDMISVVKYSN